jgi:hypothetical protein
MPRALPAAAAALTVAASLIASAGAAVKTAHTPAAPRVAHVANWGSTSFQCEPAADAVTTNTDSVQSCAIVTSAANASCVEKSSSPDVTQTCTITQTSDNNSAFILQDDSTGDCSPCGSTSTQDVTQTATVTQAGTNNSLDATQQVNQSLSGTAVTTLEQNQDNHQSIVVCQGKSGDCTMPTSGTNSSKIHQSRFASEHASGGMSTTITQNQDQATGPTSCDPVPFRGPLHPSLCAVVQQNSTNSNDSDLHQENHLQEVASGLAAVTQNQQKAINGIDGHADQLTPDATSSNVAHQHQTDDMSAPPGAMQTQDPELDCCSTGGSVNGHQVAIERASQANATQDVQIFGNCNAPNCNMHAHGKINGAQATDVCNTSFCSTFVGCSEGTCTTTPPDLDLASLGFDTLDFTNAINFVFPLSLPLTPV